MSAIGLLTHGYIDDTTRVVPGPRYIDELHPDTKTEDVRPEIVAHATEPPRFKIQPTRPVRPSIRPMKPRKQRSVKGGR